MYMDILKTVCTIGAVTIFYFCPIPLELFAEKTGDL